MYKRQAARYAVSPDAGSHPGVLGAVTPLGLTGSFRLATWGKRVGPDLTAVSYTHLTLPTSDLV